MEPHGQVADRVHLARVKQSLPRVGMGQRHLGNAGRESRRTPVKTTVTTVAAVLLVLALSVSGGESPPASPGATRIEVEETLVAAFKRGRDPALGEVVRMEFSGDYLHVALVAQNDAGERVVVDGQPGRFWTKIAHTVLTQDGKHVAYVALDGKQYVLVVDGQPSDKYDFVEGLKMHPTSGRVLCEAQRGDQHYLLSGTKALGPYDGISCSNSPFSASGNAYSAVVITRPEIRVVVNDELGPAFDGVPSAVVFSPDGKRFGYVVSEDHGRRKVVIIDGRQVAEYEDEPAQKEDKGIDFGPDMVFSPDSRRVAFRIRTKDGTWCMRVDGADGPGGRYVGHRAFSPDSRHFAYIVHDRDGKMRLALDGTPGEPYEYIASLTFSPDGGQVAFAALRDGKRLVVLGGKDGPAFGYQTQFGDLLFSPNSRHLFYVASARGDDVTYAVVDNQKFGPFQVVGSHSFSPDGQHYGFMAQRGGKWLTVVDGKEEKEYEGTGEIAFSADGTSHAYSALEGKQRFMVQDGREGPRYDSVAKPLFSPAGRQMAYIVTKKNEARYHYQWQVVLDGRPGPAFDGIYRMAFTADGRLVYAVPRHFIVVDGVAGPPVSSDFPYTITPEGDIVYGSLKEDGLYRVRLRIVGQP